MNKAILIGRLTRDPEVRYSQGDNATAIARFSMAINRKFKNKEGNYEADFINCTSFGKQAEFVEKYFHKGDMIAIVGRIQTGSYTKDGVTVYTTDVIVEEVEFAGGKSNSGNTQNNTQSNDDFLSVPDGIEDGLPFN